MTGAGRWGQGLCRRESTAGDPTRNRMDGEKDPAFPPSISYQRFPLANHMQTPVGEGTLGTVLSEMDSLQERRGEGFETKQVDAQLIREMQIRVTLRPFHIL